MDVMDEEPVDDVGVAGYEEEDRCFVQMDDYDDGDGTVGEKHLPGEELFDLMILRLHKMVHEIDDWGEEYETADLDADTSCMKMYLMYIGNPTVPGKVPLPDPLLRKTLKASAGAVRDVDTRIATHNDPDPKKRPVYSRHGGGNWTLVMTVYVPPRMREYMVTRLPRDYWKRAHGIAPKLRRGREICELLRLRYRVPEEYAQFAQTHFDEAQHYDSLWQGLRNIPLPDVAQESPEPE